MRSIPRSCQTPARPALLAALALACTGCGGSGSGAGQETWFEPFDAGLDFQHDNGMRGDRTLVEILGPGGAALDVDDDGDMDLVLRQGAPLDAIASGGGDRLYLNQLRESGRLWFVDASAGSGLDRPAYGIGIATGDFDGDGRVDLYLSNFGPDRLLRNLGNGRFEDVTESAGIEAGMGITGAAAFVDIDADDDLDLFVAGYTDFSLQSHKACFAASGALDYCGPLTYAPAPMHLFRNRRDGIFDDASAELGIADARANALGIASTDIDGNGHLDVFIASDALENLLWMNDGRHLRDEAMTRGVALNGAGLRTGDMGVAFGDVDGDGRFDLVSTHLATEFASLWMDRGEGQFEDRALALGLGRATGGGTGFGVAFLDADLDGWLDLAIVNGEVRLMEAQAQAGSPLPLQQRGFLLHNQSGLRFEDQAALRAPALAEPMVGRGLVVADFDDDGDSDLVLLPNHGSAVLLLGTQAASGRWVGLDLRLPSGAPALGAVATLRSAEGRKWRRHVHVDGSYASARDPRILLGLGEAQGPFEVRIDWGAGHPPAALSVEPGAYHHAVRGQP